MSRIEGKKILLLITKSNWGGAQAYVYALATGMRAKNADIVVACGGNGHPGSEQGLLAERVQEAGIRVAPLNSLVRNVSLAYEIQAFFELVALLKKERPDVLHLNSSKAGGLGALAARVAGVPNIIFTVHGWAHREPRPLYAKILIWLASWATILFSHRVIVVSQCDYDTSPVFLSKKKITLVHNGIRPSTSLSKAEGRQALQAFSSAKISDDAFWFLMNGELHRNKATDIAIRAFQQIHAKNAETVLVVISDGEDREALQNLILELGLSDSVFLLGFVPDARKYMAAADVFVLSSRKEGFPLVLLEAGNANVPVIASNVGGIPEIVTDQVSGLLVPAGDIQALVKACQTLLANSNLREAYAAALHEKVLNDFSEERMLEATEKVYAN